MARPTTCTHWNTTSTTLLLCTNCKVDAYCNRECQKADWEWHKAACKPIIIRHGDAVSIVVTTNDPYQPRAFQTFQQVLDKYGVEKLLRAGNLPRGCCTVRRTAVGSIEIMVNEERYQEISRREAEVKAAEEKAAEEKAATEKAVKEEATEEKTVKEEATEETPVREETAEEKVAKASQADEETPAEGDQEDGTSKE
jgi:hypothetical protein